MSRVATIWWAKLDRVYYANALDDTRSYFELAPLLADVAKPIDARSTPSEQLLAADAFAVIKDWVERSADHPMFKSMTATDVVHIPYKGAGQAMIDLVGGQVQMAFAIVSAALP